MTHREASSQTCADQDESVLGQPAWAHLVHRIRRKEDTALSSLYEVFSRGVRASLWQDVGPQEVDDRLHDAFLIVTKQFTGARFGNPSA